MADTISVAGHRVNKWYVYGGVGGAVLVGVLYLRNRSQSGGAGSSGNASATDPVTGLPYSMDNQVDPATGLTYLSEAQQYGSVSAAEAAVGGGYGGVSGTGTGYSGLGYGTPSIGGSATGTGAAYATNADWAQAVIAALPSITGDSQSDVASAVANYLAGLPLSSTQANDIQVALAEFGPPPSGSFSIVASGSGSGVTDTGGGGTTTGGGGGGGTTTPPPAKGGPITVTPVNLHVTHTYSNSAQVAWIAPRIPSGQGPLTGYGCACYDSSGRIVNGPFTVGPSQLYANFGGLKSKTQYHATIWCDPAKTGGPHATVSFKTS